MYDHVRSTSKWAIVFFILTVVIGNFMLLTLFQAILLKNFEDQDI